MKNNKDIKTIMINDRPIGLGYPPYIIAELSANHNGDIKRALKTIEMAKKMGAEAIKFQTYTPDTLTIDFDGEDFQIHEGLWEGYSLYQLYQWAYTPFEWHEDLFNHAKKQGITCFSTPFDETAVDLLEELKTPVYKIASFELIDLPLIKYVAKTGKPMIISTGMGNLEEISEAVETAREGGCEEIILLHCISGYPTPFEQSNLRTIPDLANKFDVIVGLSDHTLGTAVSVASVALDACVIEKHVTLSRKDSGPDTEFSLEPSELKKLCIDSKIAWEALGTAGYDRKTVEEESIKFRRSIYAIRNIRAGEKLTSKNIRRIRPGFGLSPKYYEKILGSTAKVDILRGTRLTFELITWNP
ncbi:pseudaminic acid synthase [Thermodesulfobacteriota bacterium]